MARKILNRRELRAASDAAEAAEVDSDSDAETEEGKKPAAKKPAKKAAKRKSRAKTAKEVRLKAMWGVFNQSLKRIAVFDYSERAAADKKAAEMSTSQKTPHFVQLVKEPIEA